MSGCQRQISECCNDSLEICFLDTCDIVAFDDKDNMYEVDLNNYRRGLCGTTDDSGISRYRKGKTVSCINNPYKLPIYLIFTHLYVVYIGTF